MAGCWFLSHISTLGMESIMDEASHSAAARPFCEDSGWKQGDRNGEIMEMGLVPDAGFPSVEEWHE